MAALIAQGFLSQLYKTCAQLLQAAVKWPALVCSGSFLPIIALELDYYCQEMSWGEIPNKTGGVESPVCDPVAIPSQLGSKGLTRLMSCEAVLKLCYGKCCPGHPSGHPHLDVFPKATLCTSFLRQILKLVQCDYVVLGNHGLMPKLSETQEQAVINSLLPPCCESITRMGR